ncbi:DUF3040 domain-containing protein [Hamadaea tsunoensis]|uniref:DUF3040 domain-containing protein n=1 Tax=Hamadaea tsunoensis TaxID=53368 RepID=UPI00041BD568|nr:DUF3040 domain-containing protein [Hamadaea tsunoensis]
MLTQYERDRLAEIERFLVTEDPAFARRMRTPRRPVSLVLLAVALWAAALIVSVLAGVVAVVVTLGVLITVEVGWQLYRRAHRAP